MKIKSTLLLLLAFSIGVMLCAERIMSSSNAPPVGYTGSGASGNTCASSSGGCHTGGTAATIVYTFYYAGTTIPATTYQASQSYDVTVTVSGTGNATPKYGFEMDATIVSSNLHTGVFALNSLSNSSTTSILSSGNYVGHHVASATTSTWYFKWTAPATNVGNVIFNIAGNYANGNLSTSGDNINTANFTISYAATCVTTTFSFNDATCSTYSFGGQTLTTSGLYNDTLVAGNYVGCDSIIMLNLTVNSPSVFLDTVLACDSFLFNSQTLTTSGVYRDTLFGGNYVGCDSIIKLHLTIHHPSSSAIAHTICSNDIYNLNGKIFSSAGIYNDTILNHAGCDSIITLTLSVNNISASLPITQMACNSFMFGSKTLTSSGTYYDTLTNYLLCDSLLILNLTINNSSASTIYDTTCSNVPFVLNGKSFATGGVHYDTIQNYVLCDSVITLNLFVKPIVISNLSHTMCLGDVYLFNHNNITAGGNYFDTLTSYNGCDSILALSLTVNNPSASATSGTLCNGNNFVFNTKTYSSAGTFYDTLVNYVLCDSIITITVINGSGSASAFSHTTCSNNPYYFHNQFLSVSNNYNDTIPNYVGCDSIITLTLNVLPTSSSAYSDTICGNQFYSFNNHNLTIGGTYFDTLQNYLLCDSIITLTLVVKPISNYAFTQNICGNSSFLFKGNNLNATGFYKDTLLNYHLCDSIITLHLIVHQPDTTVLNQRICKGSNYLFNNQTLTTAGVYWDTLSSVFHCDSFIMLHLFVDTTTYASISQTICANNFYHFHNQNLNQIGTYYDTISNYHHCDSIITLTLNTLSISGSAYSYTTCVNQPYHFNNQNLNIPGTYFDTLQNYLLCDSIITLTLNTLPISGSSLSQTICANQPYYFHHRNINVTGTYYDTLTNYLGCDSVITLNLLAIGVSNHIFHDTTCAGQPYNFYGRNLTMSGLYLDTFTGYLGCDSLITLHLIFRNPSSYSFSQILCGGQSYTFNGHNLTLPGTYFDTLTNHVGCDSLITLHLVAGSNSFSNITQTICSGSSYTFHHQNLTTSGIYYDTVSNPGGCNTLVTLNLTVLNSSTSTQTHTMCNRQTYTFYGQHLSASGVYTAHLTNHLGCDSSVVLTLTVNSPNVSVNQVDTTLSALAVGSSYQWLTCHGSNQNVYSPIAGATNSVYIADTTGWYAVMVTTNGCIDTSICYFVNKPQSTGINALSNHAITIYPNPTSNLLNIKWQNEEVKHIVLQDAVGRKVKDILVQGNVQTLSVTDLPQGIYFIHLFGKTETVIKIVKE